MAKTGHYMLAQEHFVSNIVRQKLIVAIHFLPCNPGGKSCILFLPEGEYHELGLLFLSYLVKNQGGRIIYLGANVPMKDVESVITTMKPQMAFVHLTSNPPNFNFEKFLKAVEQRNGNIPTIISGFPTHNYSKALPASIQLKKNLAEVMKVISTL